MPMPWIVPANFDGAQFAARYNLQPTDFWAEDGQLHVRPGVQGVPDPPILDVCLPPTAATKADGVPVPARVVAAVALRLSPTTWARLTVTEQAAVQAILDAFAGKVAAAIRN